MTQRAQTARTPGGLDERKTAVLKMCSRGRATPFARRRADLLGVINSPTEAAK